MKKRSNRAVLVFESVVQGAAQQGAAAGPSSTTAAPPSDDARARWLADQLAWREYQRRHPPSRPSPSPRSCRHAGRTASQLRKPRSTTSSPTLSKSGRRTTLAARWEGPSRSPSVLRAPPARSRWRRARSTDCGPGCGFGAARDCALQLSLELGQRREDAEHEAAGRGGGFRRPVRQAIAAHGGGRRDSHGTHRTAGRTRGHPRSKRQIPAGQAGRTRCARRESARGTSGRDAGARHVFGVHVAPVQVDDPEPRRRLRADGRAPLRALSTVARRQGEPS